MKLALVTPTWESRSRAGELARELARHLADTEQIDVFVEPGREGGDFFGWTTRSARALVPRDYDHVLYVVANDRECAFELPLVRALGGCVVLGDWALASAAFEAYPELAAGGLRGVVRALREGGASEARLYARASGDRAAAELVLNRSIVRFADSFVVGDEATRSRVLESRNAPTPIGVLELVDSDRAELARGVRELLERFPPPRTARKHLFLRRAREELRRGD